MAGQNSKGGALQGPKNDGKTSEDKTAEELNAANARIAELEQEKSGLEEKVTILEGQLEEAAANSGDEALAEENKKLKTELSQVKGENEQLKAAKAGSDAKDGGKEARGEEVPEFMKPDYTGPITGDMAEKIHKHRADQEGEE